MQKLKVNTTLANLWTSPDSPREVDGAILAQPVEVKTWLQAMSHEEQLALTSENLLQSQALYGTEIKVLEEQGDWVKVVIPDQPSSKDERGYPGWIARRQLQERKTRELNDTVAIVNRPMAWMYGEASKKELEVSFQTRLPVESQNVDWVGVRTPFGIGYLKREDILLESQGENRQVSGHDIVQAGEQFLGLPYVWGGMSGFGYDCSGFAHTMHRAVGKIIPRDASDQAKEGRFIKREDLEPGDLLFFAYEEGKGTIHHVGIYHGDGKMIHAPNTGKSIEIITLAGSKYEIELWGARRYH